MAAELQDPPAPETNPAPQSPPRRGFGWPHAAALVGLALVAGAVFVLLQLGRTADRTIEAGKAAASAAVDGLERIAEAFATGTVTTTFRSYATQVSGNSYLQFATLDEQERFERTDAASILWGQLDLPDVVVEATAPVQYTYYLDLNDPWHFEMTDTKVRVIAPQIRFNRPSLDASQLEWNVKSDSVFRDEEAVREALRAGLTAMAEQRARDNVPLVREIGRRRTQSFVETWLLGAFGDASQELTVEVKFLDETTPFPDLAPSTSSVEVVEPRESPE